MGRYDTDVSSADPGPPREAVPADGLPSRPPVRVVELDWRSVVPAALTFVGLVALTGVVRSVPRTLGGLAVGTLLALALNPVVSGAQRRLGLPRQGAVAAVLLAFVAALVMIALLLVPPAVRQAGDLRKEVPRVAADLADLPVIGDDLARAGVPETLERAISELPQRLAGNTAPLERAGRSAADMLIAFLVTMLFTITLLLDARRLSDLAARALPAARRARVERVGDLAYRVVGRYVAGSLAVAGIAGLSVLVAGLVLGVPLTPLLAVWVPVWSLVPQIGGAMGGIPFVLLGLTEGPTTGVLCAVFFMAYLQIENNVIAPLMVGNAVKLSPPATMTAALIGVSAGGVVGALIAVPLVGAAKVVYLELRPPPDDDEGEEDPGATERRAATARRSRAWPLLRR